MNCKNWETSIDENSKRCDNCQTSISDTTEEMLVVQATPNMKYDETHDGSLIKQNKIKNFIGKHRKIVIVVSGIVSVIGLFIAIKLLVNGSISYCVNNYNKCMDGYRENSMYYSNGYLGSAFRGISNSYKELAGAWMKRIWVIIIKVIISGIIGILSGILCLSSYRKYKKSKQL